jgi:hypothetical protein
MSMIQQNPKLAQVKPEILTKKKVEDMDWNLFKNVAAYSSHFYSVLRLIQSMLFWGMNLYQTREIFNQV